MDTDETLMRNTADEKSILAQGWVFDLQYSFLQTLLTQIVSLHGVLDGNFDKIKTLSIYFSTSIHFPEILKSKTIEFQKLKIYSQCRQCSSSVSIVSVSKIENRENREKTLLLLYYSLHVNWKYSILMRKLKILII